jgi:homoserine acetyltransferase
MTKTIEFVEEEIIICNQNIDFQMQLAFEKQENKFAKRYHENEALKLTEKLQMLHQIKCELEAWEVVKEQTLITDGGVIVFHMAFEDDNIYYETIKKALEVEDE